MFKHLRQLVFHNQHPGNFTEKTEAHRIVNERAVILNLAIDFDAFGEWNVWRAPPFVLVHAPAVRLDCEVHPVGAVLGSEWEPLGLTCIVFDLDLAHDVSATENLYVHVDHRVAYVKEIYPVFHVLRAEYRLHPAAHHAQV